METKVYRGFSGKRLRALLLFLSLVLVVGGLLSPQTENGMSLSVAATATPIPLDEAFDDTTEQRSWTLPSRTWYALQLGSFDNAEGANALAEQYRVRGAAGYVWSDTRYRTLAALYENENEVRSVRNKLWESHGIDAYPYRIELPAITLEMQGMRGQLDILQAAFLHAQDLVMQLQQLSLTLDRQETDVEGARATLTTLAAQVEAVALRLRQRFGEPRHASVTALTEVFESYIAAVSSLPQQPTAVELATETKYQALAALERLHRLCNALWDT